MHAGKQAFEPDYRHVVDAAYNRQASRLPLYEHGMDIGVIEQIINKPIRPLLNADVDAQVEGLSRIAECAIALGYDCIPFECSICDLIQGGKGLTGQAKALIKSNDDLDAFPWDAIPDAYGKRFEQHFDALRQALPDGMKAIGGVGYGPFESIQDFVPYEDLIYLQVDQPELYKRALVANQRYACKGLVVGPRSLRRPLCGLPVRR
jgi:uroporphyrinogen decarboxylase